MTLMWNIKLTGSHLPLRSTGSGTQGSCFPHFCKQIVIDLCKVLRKHTLITPRLNHRLGLQSSDFYKEYWYHRENYLLLF